MNHRLARWLAGGSYVTAADAPDWPWWLHAAVCGGVVFTVRTVADALTRQLAQPAQAQRAGQDVDQREARP